jgi:hypothetical protein
MISYRSSFVPAARPISAGSITCRRLCGQADCFGVCLDIGQKHADTLVGLMKRNVVREIQNVNRSQRCALWWNFFTTQTSGGKKSRLNLPHGISYLLGSQR